MNLKIYLKQLIAITSCFLEIFTDKRAPNIGKCYILINYGSKFWLRAKPEDIYTSNNLPTPDRDAYFIEPQKFKGSLIVLKIVNLEKEVYNQWVQVIFSNSNGDTKKGYLPRWEFCQLVDISSNK